MNFRLIGQQSWPISLRHRLDRNLALLRQRPERPPQPMQVHVWRFRPRCLGVSDLRLGEHPDRGLKQGKTQAITSAP